ncbi:hypothetical protein IE81DRAFT_345210 [Ceraceosorus guamensis]|uniref:Uncharacterized protein n=1 Tax=Ceraceosorus guamensis TaxID=1522189 RepID=A0A316W4I9_9BASI|nr:hypothetical protein IE81DRAFT_345210 [Ceraceosorus guamensis]PWN44816.1 hypothetical protein IE81DRAFT_345210 [Ceraceosorus guamensis]
MSQSSGPLCTPITPASPFSRMDLGWTKQQNLSLVMWIDCDWERIHYFIHQRLDMCSTPTHAALASQAYASIFGNQGNLTANTCHGLIKLQINVLLTGKAGNLQWCLVVSKCLEESSNGGMYAMYAGCCHRNVPNRPQLRMQQDAKAGSVGSRRTNASSSSRVAAAGSSTSDLLPSSPTPTPTPAHQAGLSSQLLPSLPIMATSPGASASTATVAPSASQPPLPPAPLAIGLSAQLAGHIPSVQLPAGIVFACQMSLLTRTCATKVTVEFMTGSTHHYLAPCSIQKLGARYTSDQQFRLNFMVRTTWKEFKAVANAKVHAYALKFVPHKFVAEGKYYAEQAQLQWHLLQASRLHCQHPSPLVCLHSWQMVSNPPLFTCLQALCLPAKPSWLLGLVDL